MQRIVHRQAQSGIGLAYVLLVIALLSLTSLAASKLQRNGGQTQWAFEAKQNLLNQYQLIRSRIISCGISYPAGDNTTGYRVRYPAAQDSLHPAFVINLTCPGQTFPNNIWSGTGGITLPAPPAGFDPWMYVNDGTSMRIIIQPTVTTDPGALRVLDAVANRIGSDNATRVGATLEIKLLT